MLESTGIEGKEEEEEERGGGERGGGERGGESLRGIEVERSGEVELTASSDNRVIILLGKGREGED